jgi:hypothetical protein
MEERELCAGKLNEGKRERRGACIGGGRAPGAHGQGRAGLGQARLGRESKSHDTHNH